MSAREQQLAGLKVEAAFPNVVAFRAASLMTTDSRAPGKRWSPA